MSPSPTRARVTALATATALVVAALTGVSAQVAAAAVGPDGSGGVLVDAGYLRLGMNAGGQVTSLVDRRSGRNYVATGQGTAPLVSLMVGGQQVMPSAVTLGQDNTLVFTNSGAGVEIDVALQEKATYTTLEVTNIVAPPDADVQTLLWGPLATNITQTLGESVGIVRDSAFAVGMKPLTDRTEGGWPREEVNTAIGWQNQVAANPSQVQVSPLEEWSVGARTPWGTLLRAFTFDYTTKRDRQTGVDGGTLYPVPVGPLANGQGSVVGSKIALFGTTPDLAPTVLSNVAVDQNLPYPTINGQWQKAAQATSKSILVLSDLYTGNVAQAAEFTKAGGMDMVYALGSTDGPWQSDGHYQFDWRFGGSDSAATTMVNEAKANGIQVGAHTLSDFVSQHDAWGTPVASPDLAYGQSATATRSIAVADNTIYLSSCAPVAAGVQNSYLKIDDEVVQYAGYSQVGDECRITGVNRAWFWSKATAHTAGATANRVLGNSYGGALGGLNIIDNIATRFASIWNTTGITGMSFDGLESASQSGWGSYGISRLVNDTFRRQNAKDGFISETSRMTSNTWDGLSRASWGEVGSTSMNQLYLHNVYYQDNYLPGVMGWINPLTSFQTLEDTLARGASFNGGAGFRTSVSALASNPDTPTVLSAIKQWESARNLGAFTPAQKAQMRDQSTHWHLSVVTEGTSWSLQQLDGSGTPVGAAQSVVAPTPAFTTASLPSMTAGSLYEAKVATNTPQTIRYSVTSGALPAGLSLNQDTGGITGTPTSGAAATFTVTGKGGAGTADAVRTYTINSATSPVTGPITSGLSAAKCVDANAGSSINGTAIDLYDCNGTAAQNWTVAGDGSLRALGKCMDVTAGATGNGAKVELYECNGTGAQVWQPQPGGALLNPQSGRCLDVPGANTANGLQLQIYDCNNTPAQKWTLPA
ncbi:Ig domain-containing protein [Streptomyces sp. NRRL WC-3742]|uniref:Ig domain-containing protein n=1 Tax=Streptomyces sp. NRRL WC-3742 TaxID=1463934 RepID=UPI0006902EE3|nr:Ig domain-containing protein [Streptomyces sp. NRRL WC-3742]